MQRLLFYLFIIFSFKSFAQDLAGAVDKQIASVGPNCIDVYKKLHTAPELSTNEFETGKFLKKLRYSSLCPRPLFRSISAACHTYAESSLNMRLKDSLN